MMERVSREPSVSFRPKNLIYQDTLGLQRSLFHGLNISFQGHPVFTFCLRDQINVNTAFESEDFVFERDSGTGRSILEGKICGFRINNQTDELKSQFPMTRWLKLENCQWAFGEEKVLAWLSNFGKPLTPLEEETYSFRSDDKDECKDPVGTGNLSTKMTIEKEIPQFLPMMGRKVRVYYRGISKLCINCYQPGDIKKKCQNSTVGSSKTTTTFQMSCTATGSRFWHFGHPLFPRETLIYKRKFEEKNSHVILLKFAKEFAINNLAGL